MPLLQIECTCDGAGVCAYEYLTLLILQILMYVSCVFVPTFFLVIPPLGVAADAAMRDNLVGKTLNAGVQNTMPAQPYPLCREINVEKELTSAQN